MNKLSIVLFLSFLSVDSWATCEQFEAGGTPVVSQVDKSLCHANYKVGYYSSCKVPLYVLEHLESKNLTGDEPRLTFKQDPLIAKRDQASNKDYSGSGYDKGHLAPAGDFKETSEAMKDSFLFTNAVPQFPRINRGIWKSLEIKTRDLANKTTGLYVITGGTYSANPNKIGSGVCVPNMSYKVIIDVATRRGSAYAIPNISIVGNHSLESYRLTIKQLETDTGIDFLPIMDSKVKSIIKNYSTSMFN